MATRKPMFMNDEGFSEEMAATDDMALGALSVSPGNINMNGSGKVTGLVDGSNPQDAVTKSQLDAAVISGGTVKELLLHEAQLDDTQGILAAMALFFAANPASGDTITITDGTTTRTYGADSGGDVQFTIGATAADSMANFASAVQGDGSAAWGAYYTSELDGINAGGVVVLTEDVTAAGASASRVYGTWATPANVQVVEYASGTTPDVDADYRSNTSATMASSDPTYGRFGLRNQQTALEDGEIHNVRNDDSLYSWDDADDVWQVLSGASSVPDATAASGGGIKGKITVDSDYGLAVSSGILTIALTSTVNPGLEFNATDKGLSVLIDPNDGLESNAAGLGVKTVSADRLTTGAGGLDVAGVPASWKIGGSTTDASAAELETLTDGSNADALHVHAAPTAVDEAKRVENDITTSEAVSLGDPVYVSGNDTVGVGDAGVDAQARIIGVARTAAGSGNPCPVVTSGEVPNAGSGWTANQPIYLADGGGLTNTRPAASKRIIVVGYAMNATDLFVEIRDYGKRAA